MKKIIFYKTLVFGLLLSCIPMPLQSSSWGWEGIKQGASSLYSYMPNVSEYMPSSPQWVTSLMNILSEHNKLILLSALATVLGYKIYSHSQATQAEDQATREQAFFSHSFQDNGTDFSLETNATNIIRFLKIASNDTRGMVVIPSIRNEEANKLVKPERLFRAFIYPVLEKLTKDKLSAITSKQGHRDFWNNTIKAIKASNKSQDIVLTKSNHHYLNILRQQLEEFIKNNNSPTAQEILSSLNQASDIW